jgi:hypothetical protein
VILEGAWYSAVVVEGACDRFCGRPVEQNPYHPEVAAPQREAWTFGWEEADWVLGIRGQQEAARWLGEAA